MEILNRFNLTKCLPNRNFLTYLPIQASNSKTSPYFFQNRYTKNTTINTISFYVVYLVYNIFSSSPYDSGARGSNHRSDVRPYPFPVTVNNRTSPPPLSGEHVEARARGLGQRSRQTERARDAKPIVNAAPKYNTVQKIARPGQRGGLVLTACRKRPTAIVRCLHHHQQRNNRRTAHARTTVVVVHRFSRIATLICAAIFFGPGRDKRRDTARTRHRLNMIWWLARRHVYSSAMSVSLGAARLSLSTRGRELSNLSAASAVSLSPRIHRLCPSCVMLSLSRRRQRRALACGTSCDRPRTEPAISRAIVVPLRAAMPERGD